MNQCRFIIVDHFPLIVSELGVSTMQRLFNASSHLGKRTALLLLSFLSLSTIFFSACGSDSNSKTTLTVLASQDWVRSAEQELAKKFETQTGIHIDYQIIPSANYFQVLNTKLKSGGGPDIFMGQSGVSDLKVTYNVEANAVDLSDQEWVKREDASAVSQSTLNGKVYGQEIWDIYSGYL
jgi:raffinose/stachyose/melibiose transport system substrate-binding protein